MKNSFINVLLLSTLNISSMNMVYANTISAHTSKSYILKITSKDPNIAIPFTSTFMTVLNDSSAISSVSQKTPSEIPIKANFLATMIQVANNYSEVKVEIIQKNEGSEESILSGTGHSIVTHNGWNSGTFVFAK